MALLFGGLAMAGGEEERLTLERLYGDPAIDGPAPRKAKLSPDGSQVSFLQGKEADYLQQDLWAVSVDTGQRRRLVDSLELVAEEVLSEEEKARRERAREQARGIVAYSWSEDGKALLFPLGGDVWHHRLTDGVTTQLTDSEDFETDVRTSPKGTFVSFVRAQNLYTVAVDGGTETALSSDGGATVSYGVSEFVAQEELGRSTGYWWSPDERWVALTRVDEAPVGVEQRVEIHAERVEIIAQRYPRAGTANADVALGVVPASGGEITWLSWPDDEEYLARVTWTPDSTQLAVQTLDRLQQRLRLYLYDIPSGERRLVLEDTDESWVNLHDDLRFLGKGRFVWSDEDSGYRHLAIHRLRDGKKLKQLTRGPWVVSGVEAVDDAHLWFSGFADSTVEKHLYRVGLDGRGLTQLTEPGGWHEVSMDAKGKAMLDAFSSPSVPPQVSLRDTDGSFVAWIEENPLDDSHPYAPYRDAHALPEFGQLPGADGTLLDYSLLRPPDFDPEVRYPVVLAPYGGPHGHRVVRGWNTGWERILANAGYVVLTVDARGSYDRGHAFEAALHRRMGMVEVDDQVAAAGWVREQPWAGKVGVFGWSYGGYLTLMALSRHPGAFDAGVAVAPVTDWTLYDTAYTERYMGLPADNVAGYTQSDVLTHAGALADPLLVIHGMADDNVLFLHTTRLFAALQEQGVLYEELTYPGKKHGIRGKQTRIHLFSSVLAFLERQLRE